jgi:hypothetical protein
VTVSLTIAKGTFPLNGKELKIFLENLWIFPVAVNDPARYEAWSQSNPADDALIGKLVAWAEQKYHEKLKNAGVVNEDGLTEQEATE